MIRHATEDDLPEILEIVEEFYSLTPYSNLLKFSPLKALQTISNVLSLDMTEGIVLVLDNDGVKGVIAAILNDTFCSDEKVATEIVWYVKPEHRNKEALRLHQAFETWSNLVGSKITAMSDIKGGSTLEKYYNRQGYVPIETTYVKVN